MNKKSLWLNFLMIATLTVRLFIVGGFLQLGKKLYINYAESQSNLDLLALSAVSSFATVLYCDMLSKAVDWLGVGTNGPTSYAKAKSEEKKGK